MRRHSTDRIERFDERAQRATNTRKQTLCVEVTALEEAAAEPEVPPTETAILRAERLKCAELLDARLAQQRLEAQVAGMRSYRSLASSVAVALSPLLFPLSAYCRALHPVLRGRFRIARRLRPDSEPLPRWRRSAVSPQPSAGSSRLRRRLRWSRSRFGCSRMHRSGSWNRGWS